MTVRVRQFMLLAVEDRGHHVPSRRKRAAFPIETGNVVAGSGQSTSFLHALKASHQAPYVPITERSQRAAHALRRAV